MTRLNPVVRRLTLLAGVFALAGAFAKKAVCLYAPEAVCFYAQCISRYFQLEGRASREEFWMFVLVDNFILVVLIYLYFCGVNLGDTVIWYRLATYCPSMTVRVRRLHDTGHSGWWVWISTIPLLGDIILLLLYCTEGSCGLNRYGPSPPESSVVDFSAICPGLLRPKSLPKKPDVPSIHD